MAAYLWLSKLYIYNANAMSSSYTVGFPAMTAWLGAVHALERSLRSSGFPELRFFGTAVLSHSFNAQLYRGPKDYRYSIVGSANPLKFSSKKGDYERPPFIEEARCHLTVSLLIKVQGVDGRNEDEAKKQIESQLFQMKIAGGDIETIGKIDFVYTDEDSDRDDRKLLRQLMPSYAIVERRDLMMNENTIERDALDSLLGPLTVNYDPQIQEDDKKIEWIKSRDVPGWIVPIAVGFKDISGAKPVAHQRDPNYEHHFVESIVTLGEFRMPFHFQTFSEIMWEYNVDLKQGLYLCRNQKL